MAASKRYRPDQLRSGIRVEREHTRGRLKGREATAVARQIAKDHLDEIPDYYTRLLKMERDARREQKARRIEKKTRRRR